MEAVVERRRRSVAGPRGNGFRALVWGWIVGMATWIAVMVLDSLGLTPEIFGLRVNLEGLEFALLTIGGIQGVLMIPGAAAFWVWRSIAPAWSLRAPLSFMTGAAVGAGAMHFWTLVLGSGQDPVVYVVAAVVGATTFVVDALARTSRER